MKLNKTGEAGAAESGDILVTVAPSEESGIQIELSGKSVILKQFGRQIRELKDFYSWEYSCDIGVA